MPHSISTNMNDKLPIIAIKIIAITQRKEEKPKTLTMRKEVIHVTLIKSRNLLKKYNRLFTKEHTNGQRKRFNVVRAR